MKHSIDDLIRGARALALLCCTAVLSVAGGCELPVGTTTHPATTTSANTNWPAPSGMEQQMLVAVNDYRVQHGLPPLRMNGAITAQARQHSHEMSVGAVQFGHDGFEGRTSRLRVSFPYAAVAENVALNYGYDDPLEEAIRGFITSADHRRHLLGNFNLTGIGIAKSSDGHYYFTQLFVHESSDKVK